MTTQNKENSATEAVKKVSNENEEIKSTENTVDDQDSVVDPALEKAVKHADKAAIKKPLKTKARKIKAKKKPVNSTVAAKKPVGSPKPNDTKEMENTMTKNKAQFDKFTTEANNMSREGTEAFMESGKIFAKGFEELMRVSMSMVQDAAEKQSQFAKEAMSSKTLNEFAEVQGRIAKANFDDFMTCSTKISELGVKVIKDGATPLSEQANKVIIKAKSAVAA